MRKKSKRYKKISYRKVRDFLFVYLVKINVVKKIKIKYRLKISRRLYF